MKITDKMTQASWPRITLVNVRINGNSAQVYTSSGLFETQKIILQKAGLPDLNLTIAVVLDERFAILRSGKQVATEDFSVYDDCTMVAPEQVRPPVDTNPQWHGFQQFPAMAYRDMQVSHHGNPVSQQAGQIDVEQPDTRFVYDEYCNIKEIREFVHNPAMIYTGPVILSDTGTIQIDRLWPWMLEKNNQFVYFELNAGVPVNYVIYTIIGSNDLDTMIVSPAPTTNGTFTATMDSRIGSRLKSTKLDGDCCIERIHGVYESVVLTDIIGDI